MSIERSKWPELSPALLPLHSMTYDQMQAAQNAWRKIIQREIVAGRPCLPEEVDRVLVDYAIDECHRQFRPSATLHIPTKGAVLQATLMSAEKWIERAMYCIPDPHEDRIGYERAIGDVNNHTFLLHAQAVSGVTVTLDARAVGLLSELPRTTGIQFAPVDLGQ